MKGVAAMVARVEIPILTLDDVRRVVREELERFQLSDPLLDAKEAATLLGVKPRTVWDWRKEGRLPYVEISSGCFRFRKSEIEKFLDERTKREPTPTEYGRDVSRKWRGQA